MTDLNVSVLVSLVDRMSRPLRKLRSGLDQAGKQSERAQKSLAAVERTAGRGGGFERMARAAERYGRVLANNEVRLRMISRLERRRENISRQLDKQRQGLIGTAAGAAAAAAPIYTAARVEQAEIRLKTVLNADDKDAAMAQARAAARDLARTGFVGLTEAFDIQYALNSAGLQSDAAAAAANVVAKVAKVTSGAPEQVAEVVAGTFNNMADAMSGTTQEKLARIGELLTKTQFKFQIRDFGQLGEGLSYAAASAAGAKVPIEDLATVLGVLNSSQVTGSRAGTAFNAVTRNLTQASEEFGFEIKRSADGQLDFIGTLEEMSAALDGLEIDERNDMLQDVFGDEGRTAIVPLLAKLKELRDAQKDVVEGSKGIVDANARLFSESTGGQWDKTVNSVILLADSFGRTLLPGVNAVLGPLATVLGTVADLAERFPTVTAVVGGVATSLVVLRAAFLAARMASLLMTAGMLTGRIGLLRYAGAMGGVATKVLPMLAGAIRLVGAALAANPIGLALTVITGVAALVIANWDSVKSFFLGIWDKVGPYFAAAWERIKGLLSWTPIGVIIKHWQPISEFFSTLFGGIAERVGEVFDWISGKIASVTETVGKVAGWLSDTFGIGDDESAGEKLARKVVEPAKKAAATVVTAGTPPPDNRPPPGFGGPPPPAAGAMTVSITVNAAPGQDADEIAREVKRLLDRETGGNGHE
jgi:TP901 family phage tail tape measure protein